jgi:SulP family sulfate permease
LWEARATGSLAELAVAAATLALLVTLPRLTRRVPAPLIALPVAALLAALLTHLFPDHPIATIASRFHATVNGQIVDGVPPLPPLPMLPWRAEGPGGVPFVVSFATLRDLLAGAFAVAMLGGIESLLSAVVADGMAGTRHDPDAELVALGIANVVTPFFGGIPATGAIARTATNIRSGARSPFAALTHALVVLLAVLVLAPLIGHLPMAGLAALLLLVAWNMSEVKHFAHVVKVAPGSDVLVLVTCFVLTVVFDMVIAVSVGVVLAALLFMRRMAELTQARLVEPTADAGLPAAGGAAVLNGQIVVYEIAGPLFFGAAQRAMSSLGAVASKVKVVIIRMDRVPVMDATGLVALESAVAQLFHNHRAVIISGLQAQPRRLLEKSQVQPKPFRLVLCSELTEAMQAAQQLIKGEQVTATSP